MKNLLATLSLIAAPWVMAIDNIEEYGMLYGVAYYDEYMPIERLDQDFAMMQDAGINMVRIAESTWATMEPEPGVFNFKHIDRVLNKAAETGMHVIVGTPTYAIPAWMVKNHPEVMVTRKDGQVPYGARQSMDITNKDYRRYAERAINKLIAHVADHPNVIGFQVDNETKHYGTSGPNVQAAFVQWMKQRFSSLNELNHALGLNYWSNRIGRWEDFPSVNGTINASMASLFAEFQRSLVTDFLAWQVGLVNQYKRDDQFVMQNFDFEWRGYSYGIQPDVDHFAAVEAMDIAGIDVYHPTQDFLTGAEISFAGDMARSMKRGANYLVVETEAQGFAEWTPYPGQLRLQAFSNVASGANMVAYWPWHSIHNSAETYWKGLLSHDYQPNPTYNEAKTIGADFARLKDRLKRTRRTNDVAMFFSNEALTAFGQFSYGWGHTKNYNDVLRPFYDALYRNNVGVDFVDESRLDMLSDYKVIVVPALYAASDKTLQALNQYVEKGGHIIYTFKSGFSDENVQVRQSIQPGGIRDVIGASYSQFVKPLNVGLAGDPFEVGENNTAHDWMELLTADKAKVIAKYDHPVWGDYAAITRNNYGKGEATYIGFMPSPTLIEKILDQVLRRAGVIGLEQLIKFPLIGKHMWDANGDRLHFYMNYSMSEQRFTYPHASGKELFSGKSIEQSKNVTLKPWDVIVIAEN